MNHSERGEVKILPHYLQADNVCFLFVEDEKELFILNKCVICDLIKDLSE